MGGQGRAEACRAATRREPRTRQNEYRIVPKTMNRQGGGGGAIWGAAAEGRQALPASVARARARRALTGGRAAALQNAAARAGAGLRRRRPQGAWWWGGFAQQTDRALGEGTRMAGEGGCRGRGAGAAGRPPTHTQPLAAWAFLAVWREEPCRRRHRARARRKKGKVSRFRRAGGRAKKGGARGPPTAVPPRAPRRAAARRAGSGALPRLGEEPEGGRAAAATAGAPGGRGR